jgi:hypothetical protein
VNTHADIVAAIEAGGGRIAASFELDEHGRSIGGDSHDVRGHRCSVCGRRGHNARRCQGEGLPPRASSRRKPTPSDAAATPCPKCGELGHDARRHNGGGTRYPEPER